MPGRWEDFGEAGAIFRGLRSEKGEEMILGGNFFVETILPRSIFRKLGDQEMAHTARLFSSGKPGCRRWSGRVKSPLRATRPILQRSSRV